MKVTTITYRRLKNLGNYESEALEMTVTLDDEDTLVAFEALKATVIDLLDGRAVAMSVTEDEADLF